MTRDLVRMQYLNTIVGRCDGKEALCQRISDWVGQNTLWVRARVEELRRKEAYWHHVGLFYDQMLGLYQGYKASLEKQEEDPVTMEDIFTMNIFGDLEDLEQAGIMFQTITCCLSDTLLPASFPRFRASNEKS